MNLLTIKEKEKEKMMGIKGRMFQMILMSEIVLLFLIGEGRIEDEYDYLEYKGGDDVVIVGMENILRRDFDPILYALLLSYSLQLIDDVELDGVYCNDECDYVYYQEIDIMGEGEREREGEGDDQEEGKLLID
ncbi:MAG: hypothetical protein EZS28_020966 [Streblomastix strix]|uniref:Uncharacterized protein n=1 Tax=Streblomastix strix TaxID=222440 RepID=A0A5J4VLI8_9EUKA|nr:MAG: hypothetical protein EZS28_020966 [Streblomastix strix]